MNILEAKKEDLNISSKARLRVKTILLPIGAKNIQEILDLENVLGVIEYNSGTRSNKFKLNPDIPFLSVHMDSYTDEPSIEIWTSSLNVCYGRVGSLAFAADGENFFAASANQEHNENLDKLGEKVYDELFRTGYSLNYKYLCRIWNYFPNINKSDINGLERYKSFCYGRAVSFDKNCNVIETEKFPSATGIGSMSGNVNICFLSSSINQCKYIENPRQTPAYNYPVAYGPKSPSFARATYYSYGDKNFNIYVAGTASIIGHETIFVDDAENQCITALDNIELLISEENLRRYDIKESLNLKDLDCIKIYIRKRSDFPIIKRICERRFSAKASIIYIKADVCRSNLLVEIEGVIQR